MDQGTAKDFLRRQPLFESLSDDELDRLHAMSETVELPTGAWLMREGEPGDTMFVVLEGELEVTRRDGITDEVLAVRTRGEVIGEMALLQRQARTASVRASSPARLLKIGPDAYDEFLAHKPDASRAIVTTVMQRLRSAESMLMQREKLAALGTMAAGLAHELNNPAAAIARSASSLHAAFHEAERAALELARFVHDLDALGRSIQRGHDAPGSSVEHDERFAADARRRDHDPLARAEREDALGAWLEGHAPDTAPDAASVLSDAGWTPEELDGLRGDLADGALGPLLRWLVASTEVEQLLHELNVASDAIARIVGSVKRYAYLDRDKVQMVDINDSLRDTLVMLKHRLADGVVVERSLATDLPRIEALGGELNQVWTNLIDNAVDAMGGAGRLTVRSYRSGDQVVVEIADSGPGIPPEVVPRLFEPFYTTKGVGSGTGLGLHIVHNIVVHGHGGTISVRPSPGDTCFQVRLPLRLPVRG